MSQPLLVDRRVSQSVPEARFVMLCTRPGCDGWKSLGRQYLLDRMGDIVPSTLNGRLRCTAPTGSGHRPCGFPMRADVEFWTGPRDPDRVRRSVPGHGA
ncbi:hypothetical protein [Brevundimonas sp. NIBR10]|uniref:hypothetical protein n=1 Tax=Brevundimonas sp. NIBR10 TaxID=3015997 RepID=UPI0022F1B4B1|nr:hypothetical protein [Brevundimonas sp. NIBR10]